MALIRSVCRVATKYNWLTRTPSLWTRLLLANTHPSTHPHLYTRLSLLRLLNFPAEAPEAVLLDDSHYGDEDVHAVVCVCKSISGLRLRQTNIACQCGETSVQLQWAGFPTITAVVEVIGLGLGGGGGLEVTSGFGTQPNAYIVDCNCLFFFWLYGSFGIFSQCLVGILHC